MRQPRLLLCVVALATTAVLVQAQNAAVTVTVDAAADRRPINPAIYGVAFATTAQLQDLRAPLNRSGGNAASRSNWQVNADNRGSDWYFESIADTSAVAGERGDTFVTASRAGGAQPMLTVPTIGYIATVNGTRSKIASFDSRVYGAQDSCDTQWFPQACNGLRGGVPITGNNPLDANIANAPSVQAAWASHLVQTFGLAAAGGLRYYILDNEPSLWHETHRDVRPIGATMDDTRDALIAYSAAIKSVDPGATLAGPEEWGWSGYFYSGYDQQYGNAHGWSALPDRQAHGNADYLPWLLQQLKARSDLDGRRVLDVVTAHFYPQGGEFWPAGDVSTTMQLRRNRSTRALWDPAYVDETWINQAVTLIPRLRTWTDTYYYPGTPIGITEYNWGAETHINGATTQADIYGIFGREGLDLAARWTTPDASTPTYKAMKMYRNYDGNGGAFGDTRIRTVSSANPDSLSVFAAERSTDGALTVMVVSKVLSGTTPVTVSLSNFSPATTAATWQLTSANAITHLSDIAISNATLSATVPAQSVTLFVIPKSGTVTPTAPAAPANLTATAGNARAVTLAWIDNASDETGVYLERAAKTKTLVFSRFANAGANTTRYTFTEQSGTWVYRAQTYNAAGTSPYSNLATLRVR